MRCKAMLSLVLIMLLAGLGTPIEADGDKLRVEVVGPDGNPIKGKTIVSFESYENKGESKKPMAGEIIVVKAMDDRFRLGSKVVKIPSSGSLTVVVQTKADLAPFRAHAYQAKRASDAGDLDKYNAEALQAKEALDADQAALDNERKQVEQWRDENYLPAMTAEEAGAAIDRAKAQGFKETSRSVQLLMRYKSYLTRLEESEANLKAYQDEFKALKPPEKRTTMVPGVCPDGSGGLLAGLINSVTGSDLAAACDIDVRRDKNKPDGVGGGSRRDHEIEHGQD